MAREKERIDAIIARLTAVWKEHPDLRLGQLILNVVTDPALYYIEDLQLMDRIEAYYEYEPSNISESEKVQQQVESRELRSKIDSFTLKTDD